MGDWWPPFDVFIEDQSDAQRWLPLYFTITEYGSGGVYYVADLSTYFEIRSTQ